MIELTIGEEKYDLPENYDELNLEKFITLTKILETRDESDFKFSLAVIAGLIGCSVTTLYSLSLTDMNTLIQEINWVTQTPKKKKINKITIDNVNYGFINLNGITTGEMISIESFQKNVKDNKENIHFVLAILFRPINEKGFVTTLEDDFEIIKQRAELFKQKMMIGEVYGALINFTTGGTGSTSKNSAPSSTLSLRRINQSSLKK